MLPLAGQAANLDIQVMDASSGTILRNAAVCLGTAADAAQFGSRATDDRGVVRFHAVPGSPLRVTAAQPGYQAEQRDLEPVYQDRMLVMKLRSGWQKGPSCTSPAVASQSANNVKITAIDLDAVADQPGLYQIRTRVQGDAGQIRISDSKDFSGASWQPYKPSVDYSPGYARQLYVQVRRYTKIDGASLQSVSPVATVKLGGGE